VLFVVKYDISGGEVGPIVMAPPDTTATYPFVSPVETSTPNPPLSVGITGSWVVDSVPEFIELAFIDVNAVPSVAVLNFPSLSVIGLLDVYLSFK